MYQMRYIATYDLEKIGKRIRTERKAAGYSQEALCGAINDMNIPIDRQKLGEMENGKTAKFDFDILAALCDLFDCEIGYLLYEPGYENRTRAKTDISTITGLSPKSVEKLIEQKGKDNQNILNRLICSPLYEKLMSDIDGCLMPAWLFRRLKNDLKEKWGSMPGEEKQKELENIVFNEIPSSEDMKRNYLAAVYCATVTLANAIGDFSRFDKTQKEWDSIINECKRLLPRS